METIFSQTHTKRNETLKIIDIAVASIGASISLGNVVGGYVAKSIRALLRNAVMPRRHAISIVNPIPFVVINGQSHL